MVRFLACPVVPLSRDNEGTSVPLSRKVALSRPVGNANIYPTKLQSANFVPWLSVVQQSTLGGYLEPIQFEIPQTKSPMQSSLVSQSPCLSLHGLALEQQDHTFSQSVH